MEKKVVKRRERKNEGLREKKIDRTLSKSLERDNAQLVIVVQSSWPTSTTLTTIAKDFYNFH